MRNRRHLASQPLGLDEIMIVNPGSAPLRLSPTTPLSGSYGLGQSYSLFLGDDGVVYALHGPEEPVQPGDLRLGTDGAFHWVEDLDLGDDLADLE